MSPTQLVFPGGGLMRRLTLALSAVLLATAFASFVLFFSAPEARSQDQAAESQNPRASTQEGIRQTAPSEEAYFNETAVSQGTAGVQTASKMLLRAVAKDLAEEERLPDYSQVVDNDTEGRFKAPGWEERSDSYSYGGDSPTPRAGRRRRRRASRSTYPLPATMPSTPGGPPPGRTTLRPASA